MCIRDRHVGDCLREVHDRDAEALKKFGLDFASSLIIGGQIMGCLLYTSRCV